MKTLTELGIPQNTPLYRSICRLRRRGFLRFEKFEGVYYYAPDQIELVQTKGVTIEVKRELKEQE